MIRSYPDRFTDKAEHVAYVLQHLGDLHDDLDVLQEIIDDRQYVSQRFEDTTRGILASVDADTLGRAGNVLHRLHLWQKHPSVSPESYFTAHYIDKQVVR